MNYFKVQARTQDGEWSGVCSPTNWAKAQSIYGELVDRFPRESYRVYDAVDGEVMACHLGGAS